MSPDTWPEDKQRRDQFREKIKPYTHSQHCAGQKMKPAAQRTGQGLRFEMIIECSAVAPHFVAADLDQSRTKHDPEGQPAEKDDYRHRRCTPREGTRVQ